MFDKLMAAAAVCLAFNFPVLRDAARSVLGNRRIPRQDSARSATPRAKLRRAFIMPLESERVGKLPAPADRTSPNTPAGQPSGDLARLQALARLMDNAVRIPGTPVRVGLDGVLGLIPGAGDTVSALVSVFILSEARRLGISRLTLHRMATNILLDAVVGTVPFAGDAFDVYWKANHRNVELLRRHLESAAEPEMPSSRWGDWLFFGGLFSILIVIIALSLTLGYVAIRWLFSV